MKQSKRMDQNKLGIALHRLMTSVTSFLDAYQNRPQEVVLVGQAEMDLIESEKSCRVVLDLWWEQQGYTPPKTRAAAQEISKPPAPKVLAESTQEERFGTR